MAPVSESATFSNKHDKVIIMKQSDKTKLKFIVPLSIIWLTAVFIDVPFSDITWIILIKDVMYCVSIILAMYMSAIFRGKNWIIGWKEVKETGKIVTYIENGRMQSKEKERGILHVFNK